MPGDMKPETNCKRKNRAEGPHVHPSEFAVPKQESNQLDPEPLVGFAHEAHVSFKVTATEWSARSSAWGAPQGGRGNFVTGNGAQATPTHGKTKLANSVSEGVNRAVGRPGRCCSPLHLCWLASGPCWRETIAGCLSRPHLQFEALMILRSDWLKAAQAGDLDKLQALLGADPSLLMAARSTSKGYSALHYAAMAGALSAVEWLVAQGLAPDDVATVGEGVTPLQVALEYRRLPVAKRLQQLRDASKKRAEANLASLHGAAHGGSGKGNQLAELFAKVDLDESERPAARFPSWILAGAEEGGYDVPELHGVSAETEANAAKLVARSQSFVWRGAAICPAFPATLQNLRQIMGQALDTNVSRREDRKFVYFSPERLERGFYDPAAIRDQFAPMRLNEQLPLSETLTRQGAQARGDVSSRGVAKAAPAPPADTADAPKEAAKSPPHTGTTALSGESATAQEPALSGPGGYRRKPVMLVGGDREADDDSSDEEKTGGAATPAAERCGTAAAATAPVPGAVVGCTLGEGGWLQGRSVGTRDGATYVMHKLLESATAKEAGMLASRGHKLPQHLRPGIAPLRGLSGEQFALWMAGLDPIARPVAELTAWSRLGALGTAGRWGLFEQAGLMISGRDALTPTHYDGHHNVFLQIKGAKRFLLFGAEHGPNLYGFPALHPLDPLSRVDLEAPEHDLAARWPRTRQQARGAAVTLEAGDVLVMPQGVWHQVHSLDPHNVSINFLFGLDPSERGGKLGGAASIPGPQGDNLPPPPVLAHVPVHRRTAALTELAKSIETIVASAVGPQRAASALTSATMVGDAEARGSAGRPDALSAPTHRWHGLNGARDVVRQLLAKCLAPPRAGVASSGQAPARDQGPAVGKPMQLPSIDEFLQSYLDPRRFEGLPMRA